MSNENITDRMRDWGCNSAALRFRGDTTIEDYMENQTNAQIVGESIVVTKMVSSILDGVGNEKDVRPELREITKECNRMLGDVVKRLTEVASRIAEIDQAHADAAAQMAQAMSSPDQSLEKVVIEDGPTGGYVITCPKGRVVISEHRVGPRVHDGSIVGFDEFAVIETARTVAKEFGWKLVDHTADGILNPWADVGGKGGAE